MRKEPYICQRKTKSGTVTYQVRIRTQYGDFTKSFSEKDFLSSKIALDCARKYRNKILYDTSQEVFLKVDNSTVEDMFWEYLETTSDSYKTKDYHQKLFNKYISCKDKKVQELTRADIVNELNKMVEVATDDTIGRVYAIWRDDIVGTALYKEIIQKDITLGIRKPKSRMMAARRDVTTDRETVLKVEELILGYTRNKYNARVIVALIENLYYTGMRPAEVEVLTRNDIKDGWICVSKELGSSTNKRNVVRVPKTPTSNRRVPIHPNLVPVLNELMDFALTDHIFAMEDGEYMNSTWIGNTIRNICRQHGLEFNLYRLRHNMATELVTNLVDTKTTMEILGHAHYDMSLYYASSNEKLKEDAVQLLS